MAISSRGRSPSRSGSRALRWAPTKVRWRTKVNILLPQFRADEAITLRRIFHGGVRCSRRVDNHRRGLLAFFELVGRHAQTGFAKTRNLRGVDGPSRRGGSYGQPTYL